MREFFNGWRRKIGMMTLVMALVLMGLWVRSHSVKDLWGFGSGQEKAVLGLTTFPGEFRWQRQEFDREAFYRAGWYCRAYDASELAATDDVVSASSKLEWRWRRLGFDFGAATLNATSYAAPGYYPEGFEVPQNPEEPNLERVVFWTIPFYSIVLPLTAVSAFLLIFKPRQSLPKILRPRVRDQSRADDGLDLPTKCGREEKRVCLTSRSPKNARTSQAHARV
jgi:hypothetical protein